MSIETMAAVLNMDYGDSTRKLVALGLANHATKDGTAAWPGVKTLAAYANCSERTVQRHISALLDAGFIREGEQSLVGHLDARRRPIVYDVATDVEMARRWVVERDAGDEFRAKFSRGVILSPQDSVLRGDNHDAYGVTPVTSRGDMAMSPKPSLNHPMNHPVATSLRSDAPSLTLVPPQQGSREAQQPTLIEAPGRDERDDILSLCAHLAARIQGNGSKTPTITASWRKAARLLLDVDHRDETEAHNLIDWCQASDFWKANILSMPKFRQKYDTLRLQAERDSRSKATIERTGWPEGW